MTEGEFAPMENVEKELMEDFTHKIKNELRELGLIKQEERLKITKNTKGYNFEYSLLGKVENQFDRTVEINKELNKRLAQ